MATVYMLRCADGSLYVGWTENVDERLRLHNERRGGSYTAMRTPVVLVFSEDYDSREAARSRERQLKRWSAAKKEALIRGDSAALTELAISHGSPRHRSVR